MITSGQLYIKSNFKCFIMNTEAPIQHRNITIDMTLAHHGCACDYQALLILLLLRFLPQSMSLK